MLHGHSKADVRHWRLHEAALDKLRLHPELLAPVLSLLDRWLEQEDLRPARRWLEQWREMLTTWPFERLFQTVLDEEQGSILRQCSPLGPVLTASERWAALEEANRQEREIETGQTRPSTPCE